MSEQVTFAAIQAANRGAGGGGNGDSVDTILGKAIVIKSVELELGRDGESLLGITLEDGTKIRSGSKVLIKQAAFMKEKTDKNVTISTKIIKKMGKSGREYYTFV